MIKWTLSCPPASSYRTGYMATSGSIPNPIINPSRNSHYQIASPIHDSFPSPPIPISFIPSHIFHLPRPASPEKHPEAVHVGPAPQPEPGRSSTLSPIPTPATVVSRASIAGRKGTYRLETIKKRYALPIFLYSILFFCVV